MASGPQNMQSFSLVPSGAATPSPSPSPPHQSVPDGRSPNGKRPRADQSVATGRPPMTLPEVSTAVLEVQPLLRSTAEAVQWNCDLLNAVIGRVNNLESWTQLAEPTISKSSDFMTESTPKLAELVGFGDQIRMALVKVEEFATQADTKLRHEIDAATGTIDSAMTKMQARVEELSAALAAASSAGTATSSGAPAPPAGLDGHSDLQFAELRRQAADTRQRLERVDQCLRDHDNGMRQLDGRVRNIDTAAPPTAAAAGPASAPQQGQGLGAEFGASFGGVPTGPTAAYESHDIHSAVGERRLGNWKLYDEKFLLDPKNAYSSNDAATWLHDLRDYLSGRTPELDELFSWADAHATPIVRAAEYGGCLDCATPEVVSQQLWALLGGLLKGDASAKGTFANVPRHNGFEACRAGE